MTSIEVIAAVFGFLCVALYVRRNVWSWPIGLVQVILYIYVFWQAKLYADMLLHGVYVVLQLYGWWIWCQPVKNLSGTQQQIDGTSDGARDVSNALVVVKLSYGWNFWIALAIVAMTALFSFLLSRFTDATFSVPDSFIAATSLVAQFLLAHRFLETWLYWLLVNSVAIVLFAWKGLYPTTVLYILFWGMACWGFYEWYRVWRSQKTVRECLK